MKPKKIPMRKCVITGEQKPKNELIRIVRTTEQTVEIDLNGKKNGRGVYLHLTPEVVAQAQRKNVLSRHLEVDVPATIYDELMKLASNEVK